ncbi:MAG: FAD-dependent oxidoreductase [Candidatus Bipolaricaulota bacterium]|nr:MAG: FAD-dependent oxidoreductase [Candidatus Bipolaricaulota bacterium]
MSDRRETDVVVIGGGPAGLSAAAAAAEAGAKVVLVDRNRQLGGILNQCIHDGFGLQAFGEVLTGPEFAARVAARALEAGIEVHTDTMVTDLTSSRELVCTTSGERYPLRAEAVVLAMGCRERTRGMLRIPGTRPAGVYTAGAAQWLTNMADVRVGRRVFILGSGDVGLIMARRLVWEGAEVAGVAELLPYPSGLPRNVSQCLEEYDIPLYLAHSVTCIHGRDRVEAVTVTRFDERRLPIAGTEFEVACDTLLLSVGLIPENELSRNADVVLDPMTGGAVVNERYMTSVDGIFSCGNVLHIHDLADRAAEEGDRAGRCAARYALGPSTSRREELRIDAGEGIRYVVPQRAERSAEELLVSLRISEPADRCTAVVTAGDRVIAEESLRHGHPSTMVQMRLRSRGGIDADRLEVRMR